MARREGFPIQVPPSIGRTIDSMHAHPREHLSSAFAYLRYGVINETALFPG